MKRRRILQPYWTLSLALFLGLGLAFVSIISVQSQVRATPGMSQALAGTVINVTTPDDLLANDGNCSLREAIEAANNDTQVDQCPAGDGWDTINLPADIYTLTLTGASEDANATGDLDILESVTIVGAGAASTIIDGNGSDRVFHVDPTDLGVTLELRDTTVTNGYSDYGGGLRQSNGLTIIRNSVFSNNVVTTTDPISATGGAIHADHGALQIISSTIIYNDAGYYGQGGGVYVGAVALRITGSRINYNTASEGGGIYALHGSVDLQTSQVMSNTAGGDTGTGGGVFVDDGNLIVEGYSEISFNSATSEGGGIYTSDDSRLTIFDGWIHHNESDAEGGGIYAYGWGTYVRRTTIERNTSTGEGGGVFAVGDLVLIDSTVQHNHSNDSIYGGGGIYEYGDYSALVISNTVVYSNTTAGHGAGVYMYEYGGFYVFNSIFSDNRAVQDGGGAYVETEAGMLVEDSVFLDNQAANGGAIYTYYGVGLTVDGSTLSGNTASIDGGALYVSGSSSSPADIRNSTLSDNHAGGDGGAIYSYSPGVAIEFSTVAGNTAGASGGGIYEDTYSIWIQNSILAGNSAAGSTTDPNADCDIANFSSGGFNILGAGTGCEATRFDRSQSPGAIFASVLAPLADNGGPMLPGGSHPRTHALLSGSPAIDAADAVFCPGVDQRGVSRPQGNGCDVGAYESSGSAAVFVPTENIITVDTTNDELNSDEDCSLREAIQAANTDAAVGNCTAGDGWDTISLPAGTYVLTITGSGDDLNLTGDLDIITGSVTISGSSTAGAVIDGNDIDRVFNVADGAALRMENLTLTNGYSNDGGCVYADKGFLLAVDVVVSECLGTSYAGGISINSGLARLVDTTLRDNVSTGENGGIYNYYGVLTLQSSRVISNQAASHGGGVGSYYGTTRISGSDVMTNTVLTATSYTGGGGIYHEAGNLVVDDGSRIMANHSSVEGGGIYSYQGLVLIEESTLSLNSSDDDGGGYSAYYSGLAMRDTLVEDNDTYGDGGGLYYTGGLIQGSTFRYNESDGSGGGLYSWAIIENSLIEENEADVGGGIYHEGSTLFNVTVRSNIALAGNGGGLYVYSYATQIIDSTFSSNSVKSGYVGAGVYADNEPILCRGSTFRGNYGADTGGAIYSQQGVVDLLNSTVSGNSALQGGGLATLTGTLSLSSSTVATNTASGGGGGLLNGHTTVIQNSIVGGNSANGNTSDGLADCDMAAPITFAGYSLLGDGTGCTAGGRGDITVSPSDIFVNVIGSLADNGGDTWTHALLPGSPAINAGDPLFAPPPEFDQRGYGFFRVLIGRLDIGAFEKGMRLHLPLVLRSY